MSRQKKSIENSPSVTALESAVTSIENIKDALDSNFRKVTGLDLDPEITVKSIQDALEEERKKSEEERLQKARALARDYIEDHRKLTQLIESVVTSAREGVKKLQEKEAEMKMLEGAFNKSLN